MIQSSHLFVYGTLRRGARNKFARLLHSRAAFVGRGRIAGRLYRFAWHPGAILSNISGEWIYGEVFRMDAPDKLLPLLDFYEGFAFDRTSVTVQLDFGDRIEAWIYVYRNTPPRERIPSGVWRA